MGLRYEIKIRGRLSRTLVAEFEQLQLAVTVEPVETLFHGPVEDQAALYGLLRRVEALGLELVEVRRCTSNEPDEARTSGAAPKAGAKAPGHGTSS